MADYLTHITSEGERWDTISYDYYGDATLFRLITSANPVVLPEPQLAAGLSLRIPVIEEPEAAVLPGLPPWRAQ